MKSVMSHKFGEQPAANIQRSSFDRSHGYKTTFDSGYLIPVLVDEALPGDTFNLRMTSFTRLATPLHPFMDNLRLSSFFFAVPMRLLWTNWERFNGAQTDPGDSTDFLIPQMVSPVGGHLNGSLSDYFGIPTEIAGLTHSTMWHRGYNLIYNEWFRDENLQDSVVVDTGDGPDTSTDYALLRRGKRHDYFTSCLPWPQKGAEVELPLGTSAPVVTTDSNIDLYNSVDATERRLQVDSVGANLKTSTAPSGIGSARFGAVTGLETDLTTATAATINTFRLAYSIQQLLEKDARGGTRYIEMIKSHFNVTSPDYRLQRPEYLGGGTTNININPVAQTSSTDGTSPQGNLAAVGTALADGHGFTKSFTEHMIILGLVCVDADLTYQQGLDRMFSRSTRYDFYLPALAHLGEQTVLNKEIFADATAADETAFGYQERWAEYRYKPSKITGEFRSNYTSSLDTWHLSQDFAALPTLNTTFIQSTPPVSRVVAVPTEPEFLFDSHFTLRCARPMPVYSVPGLGNRF